MFFNGLQWSNIMSQDNNNKNSPSFLEMIWSVLAAMIGVQKGKNRERDFTTGNPWLFIVMGIVMTAIFVFILIAVVKMVLP
jgi:hypothetical protein